MFLALLIGIIRLMSLNFFAMGNLAELYALHCFIMALFNSDE
jgi:hypothetical protein